MERNILTAFDLRKRAARYRQFVEVGDYLAEHYQHLAELLEEEPLPGTACHCHRRADPKTRKSSSTVQAYRCARADRR